MRLYIKKDLKKPILYKYLFGKIQQHNRCGFKQGSERSNPFLYTILVVNGFNPFIYKQPHEVIIVRLKTCESSNCQLLGCRKQIFVYLPQS